jgi:hypothetical protein
MATAKKPTWKLYRAPDGSLHGDPRQQIWSAANQRWERITQYEEVLAADCEFKAALKLESFSHYKSAHFWFKDLSNGRTYMVQGTEMEDILLNHTMEKGLICGRWGWVKRGRVISIKLLEEFEEFDDEEETNAKTA